MSIPLKPWEMSNIPGTSSSSGTVPYVPNTNTDRLHSSPIPYPGSGGGGLAVSSNVAPPLPPRPGVGQIQPIYSAYNRTSPMSYSSPYSSYPGSYYSSPYSSMGMGMGMGSYGSYGGMYGNRMYGTNPYSNEPTFTQLAEESSASAFQSIESFVSAFGSISAMLESTFHALYSSFRAVVGVADHLGRVKQILSALAIFRFFKWVFRRMLYLIGISKIKPEDVESLWNSLSSSPSDTSEWSEAESVLKPNSKPSSWPILMFLGFIFAGPYLMWKLIASLNINQANKVEQNKWATGEEEHFVAVSQYDFEGVQGRELTMKKGQNIRLAPSKCQPPHVKGWVLASDGVKIGLVPTNYIKILGKQSSNVTSCSTLNPVNRVRFAQTPHEISAAQLKSSVNVENPDIALTPTTDDST